MYIFIHNEFEFEIGMGAVNNKIESFVIQLAMNQYAHFVANCLLGI